MLPMTSVLAAVAALSLIGLSISVSLCRMSADVRIGFGADERLMRRIRAQGNFTEYVPLALIVIGLAEYRGVPSTLLAVAGGLLVAGRVLHAIGILSGRSPIRAPGMVCTYLSLLVGAACLVI